ncbi:MAG: protein-disulfide reductase DsbD domain-containing protein [Paracoccaceae bacterium]
MIRLICIALLTLVTTTASQAQTRLSDLVRITVLDGGQQADGTHLAALRLTLKDGWKTYWRAPGDAGIPPRFSWTGSRNLDGVDIVWPTPVVFDQGGYRSIGYVGELVLPLVLAPGKPGAPIRLSGEMELGVCEEVCIPAQLSFAARLDPEAGRNPAISAALAQGPFSPQEAGVQGATCAIRPSEDGLKIETRIALPGGSGRETVIVEPGNPKIWASEMKAQRSGGTLVAKGELVHVDGKSFALNRSQIVITVLTRGMAVEIHGCSPT